MNPGCQGAAVRQCLRSLLLRHAMPPPLGWHGGTRVAYGQSKAQEAPPPLTADSADSNLRRI